MMLINERLYRDLREAEQINAQIARLEALVPDALSAHQLEQVKHALGWRKGTKPIAVIPIRPAEDLDGHSFSAFTSGALRKLYLEKGRESARAMLADPRHAWLTQPGSRPPAAAPERAAR